LLTHVQSRARPFIFLLLHRAQVAWMHDGSLADITARLMSRSIVSSK
jgi:hypothetical protein